MVVVQYAAEALAAQNAAAKAGVVVHGSESLVTERLMISLAEIVPDVVSNDLPQVALTQRYVITTTLLPGEYTRACPYIPPYACPCPCPYAIWGNCERLGADSTA